MPSAYSLGIAEITAVDVYDEELQSLLIQVEAALYNSEAYRLALTYLETVVNVSVESAQNLIKAVGREAIHLALGQFNQRCKLESLLSQNAEAEIRNQPVEPLVCEDISTSTVFWNDQTGTVLEQSNSESSVADSTIDIFLESIQPNKQFRSAQRAARIAAQEREDCLRQIGQKLQAERISRSMTVEQLSKLTFVLPYQINNLEKCCIDKLPEDVYVRGFIRRLGNALGLNGTELAASIPKPDSAKTVIPSWYSSNSSSPDGFNLKPIHLYLGYGACVAGAVGGLTWMTQQSTPVGLQNQQNVSPPTNVLQPDQEIGLKSSKSTKIGKPNMSPPERLSVESAYRTGSFIR